MLGLEVHIGLYLIRVRDDDNINNNNNNNNITPMRLLSLITSTYYNIIIIRAYVSIQRQQEQQEQYASAYIQVPLPSIITHKYAVISCGTYRISDAVACRRRRELIKTWRAEYNNIIYIKYSQRPATAKISQHSMPARARPLAYFYTIIIIIIIIYPQR